MQIIVKLAPEAAARLLAVQGSQQEASTSAGDAAKHSELQKTMDAAGIHLEPQHPGIDDPELSTYFTANVNDAEANSVLETLRAQSAVQGAFASAQPEPANMNGPGFP